MKLDIYNLNGDLVKSCDFESSYYDNATMRFMSKQGYSFVLDGKLILQGSKITHSTSCNNINTELDTALNILSTVVSDLEGISTSEGEDLVAETLNTKIPGQKLKIRCKETGKIYDKQSHAARDLGIDPSYVSDSIKTGKSHKGYTFERVYV